MKMNYFVLGTSDMQAAITFYDALFEESGLKRIVSGGRMTLWQGEDFMFAIAEPFDGEAATSGNGTMLGLNVGSAAEVTRLHEKALSLGSIDEGEPRIRSDRFSAYIRDLDKNKICFYQ